MRRRALFAHAGAYLVAGKSPLLANCLIAMAPALGRTCTTKALRQPRTQTQWIPAASSYPFPGGDMTPSEN